MGQGILSFVRILILLILFSLSLIASSCQFSGNSKPSVLVIAVESLPFELVQCSDSETNEALNGFEVLCQQSVRFSHAYTPSVLSQASLSSLLTGLWPFEHGVRHNGPNYLSPHHQLVSEVAYSKGYRTSFFSGGPPIWRKSGLQQGFELFEDNINMSDQTYLRSAKSNFQHFLNWLDDEVGDESFFSVIYAPDLQYFDLPAVDEIGEPIEKSFDGRLRRFGRDLFKLTTELKKRNRWESTYILLLGLNGRSLYARSKEKIGFNLHSENVQVALIIKPPQKPRDLGLQWMIDQNVSLVDVGVSLFDIIDNKSLPASDTYFVTKSLLNLTVKPNGSVDKNERPILIESAWGYWHGLTDIRYSLRMGSQLIFFDEPIKVYNTLVDRFEAVGSPAGAKQLEVYNQLRSKVKLRLWENPDNSIHLLDLAFRLWDKSIDNYLKIEELEFDSKKLPDRRAGGWLALRALLQSEWENLEKLGRSFNINSWVQVAQVNRKQKITHRSKCVDAVIKSKKLGLKALDQFCEEALTKNLIAWISSSQGDDNANKEFKDSFLQAYSNLLVSRRISHLNYVNGLVWDVASEPSIGPVEAELILFLPAYRSYLQDVKSVGFYQNF